MVQKKQLDSPCVDICEIDGATGYCKGCFRTLREISTWSRLSPRQRRDVLDVLPRRRTA
jgi:predicted Fe-S protein YdhL (DUF1289 family)